MQVWVEVSVLGSLPATDELAESAIIFGSLTDMFWIGEVLLHVPHTSTQSEDTSSLPASIYVSVASS